MPGKFVCESVSDLGPGEKRVIDISVGQMVRNATPAAPVRNGGPVQEESIVYYLRLSLNQFLMLNFLGKRLMSTTIYQPGSLGGTQFQDMMPKGFEITFIAEK